MVQITGPLVMLLLIASCWVFSSTTGEAQPVRRRAALSLNVRSLEGEYVGPLGAPRVFVGEPLEFDIRVTAFSVESDWIRRIALAIRQGSVFDKEPPPSVPLKCDPLNLGTYAARARIVDDRLVFDSSGYQNVRCRVHALPPLSLGRYTVTVTWGPDADMSRFRLLRDVDGTARTEFYLREPANDAEETDRLNNLAARAEHEENFRETLRRATEALLLTPLSARALLLRGIAHEKLGMCREATADWNAAAAILAKRTSKGIDDDPQHAAQQWRERAAKLRCQ